MLLPFSLKPFSLSLFEHLELRLELLAPELGGGNQFLKEGVNLLESRCLMTLREPQLRFQFLKLPLVEAFYVLQSAIDFPQVCEHALV